MPDPWQFAHRVAELRHQRYKTPACRMVIRAPSAPMATRHVVMPKSISIQAHQVVGGGEKGGQFATATGGLELEEIIQALHCDSFPRFCSIPMHDAYLFDYFACVDAMRAAARGGREGAGAQGQRRWRREGRPAGQVRRDGMFEQCNKCEETGGMPGTASSGSSRTASPSLCCSVFCYSFHRSLSV